MCRNIKTLRRVDAGPTEEELHLAALQFVRKVSGYRTPSRANQPAFDAVSEISAATGRLLNNLSVAVRTPRPADGIEPVPAPKPYTRPSVRSRDR
jgi:hypothetical protein